MGIWQNKASMANILNWNSFIESFYGGGDGDFGVSQVAGRQLTMIGVSGEYANGVPQASSALTHMGDRGRTDKATAQIVTATTEVKSKGTVTITTASAVDDTVTVTVKNRLDTATSAPILLSADRYYPVVFTSKIFPIIKVGALVTLTAADGDVQKGVLYTAITAGAKTTANIKVATGIVLASTGNLNIGGTIAVQTSAGSLTAGASTVTSNAFDIAQYFSFGDGALDDIGKNFAVTSSAGVVTFETKADTAGVMTTSIFTTDNVVLTQVTGTTIAPLKGVSTLLSTISVFLTKHGTLVPT